MAPKDPMTDAMMMAATHPDETQKMVQVGVSGANAAKSAGGGDMVSGAKVMAGAAAVGGLTVGCGLGGGVILGVAAAGGAAYAATRSDGIGDAAKATGKAAIVAAGKAQEFDKKHDVSGKAVAAAKQGFAMASAFDKEHNVSGKAAKGITSVMNGITKALEKKDGSGSGSTPREGQGALPPPAAGHEPFFVTAPPNATPGMMIMVQSPHTGNTFQVQIPPGVGPNGQFQVTE